ncbi:response regulator [Thalassovita taeanensis]|uniref:Response regulator receiver domain-containing protein n=1 Tax=Thalassovita taeanensis TaxID=657014 RepID=A0A1H9C4C2_9RHOB|nr:response regulator [Thalassovita taeanensis]SEP95817.1 Response regulator receiver domain-containing protein [Thalassovita taeanensis]
MRILAVDDDNLVLELLAATLEEAGHSDLVLETSAYKALGLLDAAEPPVDCILLDIQMPEMDGIELCQEIRKKPAYSKTPIIMITAMSQKAYIDRAFAAGATDYVTKPFDSVELVSRVGMAWRLHKSEQDIQNGLIREADLRAEKERDSFVNLRAPIALAAVEGVIGFAAMKNYLRQLSQGGLITSHILAFHIDQIEKLYAHFSPTEFKDLLGQIADAILDGLPFDERLLSYAGNGTFVTLAHGVYTHKPKTLELAIQSELAALKLVDHNGAPLKITASVGKHLRVGVIRVGNNTAEALHAAVRSAEQASEQNVLDAQTQTVLSTHREALPGTQWRFSKLFSTGRK